MKLRPRSRFAFLPLVLAVWAGGVFAAAEPKWNVLFIMADDYRPELGSYGSVARTPHLDRLEMRHGYFANISYMDAQVGKVLDALDRSGVADRTIIVFVGDHGYHIGEHTQWGKTSNFELDARVPLLIATPGGRNAGRRTAALVELIDLFPTLAGLCGLPAAAGLEGLSLAPVLADSAKSGKPAAFTQHPRPAYFDREPEKVPRAMGCSVRTPLVRYTEWRDWKTGATIARELYANADEPAETRNAIDDRQLAEAQREAELLLRARFPIVPH